MNDLPYPRIAPGADAHYEIDETLALSDVRPMIAKPFSPGNAFPAEEVATRAITFDKAMIGSCTNGGYDDLLSGRTRDPRRARARAHDRRRRAFVIFPGSGGVKRADRDSLIRGWTASRSPTVFRSAGGEIRESWCGPLLRPGPRRAHPGPARDHLVQPQLDQPHGRGGEGLPREPGGGRGLGAARLHGPAESSWGWPGSPELYEFRAAWCLSAARRLADQRRRSRSKPRGAAMEPTSRPPCVAVVPHFRPTSRGSRRSPRRVSSRPPPARPARRARLNRIR
mgnify:CR=1 FL=1